ncbi:hypothetical protein F8M41_001452 [Gigaspora margarita]|uniref:Uncharacterized protein n=1 Tax=Gigaspora margarita TaxID=4874 RepID=A0A8H4A998_GIGMA|nr:hypothetical protein F8M41_001452 [Gigaspora margarita]
MIDITVQSPDSSTSGTSAIGHFYMHVDDYGGGHGGGFTFIKDPIFVNGCHCSQCENIPKSYNFQRSFDLPIPPKGTWFDVWISIYWACEMDDTSSIGCSSEDVHYRTYVQ